MYQSTNTEKKKERHGLPLANVTGKVPSLIIRQVLHEGKVVGKGKDSLDLAVVVEGKVQKGQNLQRSLVQHFIVTLRFT